jgi:hypothetical protein
MDKATISRLQVISASLRQTDSRRHKGVANDVDKLLAQDKKMDVLAQQKVVQFPVRKA